ncbi:hypothetical protein [Archaeoglobus veneficus]|uniref:Uncharacterized protein n=1 Tax=Archaeoglobus veneficus (strain DSM 11195 / SNP6) TaxID=693661 RepID=F2KMF3_ARCVS|nr:hypothetical protein [Archaeoglobus veneficus]AEA46052.1 hypothetical protein Arcve_0008 [Archaeoglobus veneficus SNP6]
MKCERCSIENTLRKALGEFRGSKIAIYDIDYLVEIEKRIVNMTEEKKLRKNGRRLLPAFEAVPALRIARVFGSDYTVLFSDAKNDYYELYKLERTPLYVKYIDLQIYGELIVAGDLGDLRKAYFDLYFKDYYKKHRDDLMKLDTDLVLSVI